jgi:hypothetical protein
MNDLILVDLLERASRWQLHQLWSSDPIAGLSPSLNVRLHLPKDPDKPSCIWDFMSNIDQLCVNSYIALSARTFLAQKYL